MFRIAFNWQPGPLEWLLVLELILLVVLAGYRLIARMLGRNNPSDWFVIFYSVFWRAFRSPRNYPVPVNYLPVLPKKPKPKLDDEGAEGAGLTDEEIELLMGESGGADKPPVPKDALLSAQHADVHVRVVTGMTVAVRSIDEGIITISVNVPPDDGRANRIVIDQICTMLHLKPHQVAIQTGHTRADKSMRITGMTEKQLEEKLSRLSEPPGETIGFASGS